MEKEKIILLIEGYYTGSLSPEEESVFLQWYSVTGLTEFRQWLSQCKNIPPQTAVPTPQLPPLFQQPQPPKRIPLFRPAIAAAAAILILLIAGTWLFIQNKTRSHIAAAPPPRFKNDVAPGRNAAVLTLAGGNKITLDNASPSKIDAQGNTSITNANNQLVYTSSKDQQSTILFNTLTTGRGNQYSLVLPDGSKVWLDAASSITYPTAFSGAERKVSVSGEAYFEIAPDKQKPFLVQQDDMSIMVLGTAFNINAYDDEDTKKTTLLSGSVKIIRQNQATLLSPGQQALASRRNPLIQLHEKADIDEVMAWKNGNFKFNGATIETVMRQIERWYDVKVSYSTKITEHFVADIPRDVPLSQVLLLLELTDQVHFKLDGKNITVIP